LTETGPTPNLAFLGAARDYGARLSRARWRRALRASGFVDVDPDAVAADVFGGGSWWVVVLEENAIPIDGTDALPEPGQVLAARAVAPRDTVETLSELEAVPCVAQPGPAAALSFSVRERPPTAGERAGAYVARLATASRGQDSRPGFAAFAVPDASENARPELARLVPASARRLLDVGCGAGGFAAAVKRERPELSVVGLERDAASASRARPRLDRVLVGDARDAIRDLARAGERFDVVVCADVLEHLEDPVSFLRDALSVAARGARLIASVPNVGHASLVRDLLRGRFDPVPAGLLDAGHLRWFDERRVSETLEEAGWAVVSVEGVAGAAAPDVAAFLDWTRTFPGVRLESLQTYQWVAVGAAAS
jgi:SAM-dependent methyltransferase